MVNTKSNIYVFIRTNSYKAIAVDNVKHYYAYTNQDNYEIYF